MAFPLLRRTKIGRERPFKPATALAYVAAQARRRARYAIDRKRHGKSERALGRAPRARSRQGTRLGDPLDHFAMAESGLTRARFEALFADYDDLFDAVAQLWFHAASGGDGGGAGRQPLPPQAQDVRILSPPALSSRRGGSARIPNISISCAKWAPPISNVCGPMSIWPITYLCELIAEAQAEGFFWRAGDRRGAVPLINQMISNYTLPDAPDLSWREADPRTSGRALFRSRMLHRPLSPGDGRGPIAGPPGQ